MEHTLPRPYPLRSADKMILEDVCECDHPLSQHADKFQYGHGACGECGCLQFRWLKFIESPIQ
jgi:hypothetical protein